MMNYLSYIPNVLQKSLTVTPQAACSGLYNIDTWGIYDQPSMLQIGYKCANTQWKQRGYKLCLCVPEECSHWGHGCLFNWGHGESSAVNHESSAKTREPPKPVFLLINLTWLSAPGIYTHVDTDTCISIRTNCMLIDIISWNELISKWNFNIERTITIRQCSPTVGFSSVGRGSAQTVTGYQESQRLQVTHLKQGVGAYFLSDDYTEITKDRPI